MDLDLLKTFVAVAKYKSISIASEEVHLTQPAVTKQIKYLEDHYGAKLFDRENRFKITEEGTVLLLYAKQVLEMYQDSLLAVNDSKGQVRGVLRFGANLTSGIYLLPHLIKVFCEMHPDVKIEVVLNNTDNIVRAIKHRDISFGFISAHVKEPLIANHVFFEDKISIVFGPNVEAIGKNVDWKQLQSHPFISRERGSDIREITEQWLRERKIILKPKVELNNTEAIKQCVQCNLGFSMLPRCTVEAEIRLGLLREVSAPYFQLQQESYICHYKGRGFSRVERVFLEFVLETVETRLPFAAWKSHVPTVSPPSRNETP
jgi:LysR family transcriptional regulator, transcriptional activator of the cysJI operon